MDDKLARLKEVGFARIGQWKMCEDRIDCELQDFANTANVLYAFAVDGQLMYVGKTIQTLRIRLNGYKNPSSTQSTNIRNNRNIRECLAAGKRVDVYMLPDNGQLHYGGFHLNVAAGIEDSLIRDLEPIWNSGRKEVSDELLQAVEVPSANSVALESSEIAVVANQDQFRAALFIMFSKATEDSSEYIDVNAGQLHRRVGGYPSSDHRMPLCCAVMSASLTVRFILPRKPV